MSDDTTIKKRGRPKKIKLTEPVEPKKIGRPKIYLTDEDHKEAQRLNSKNDYAKRGHIYLKLKTYIKSYNVSDYTLEGIKHKSIDELMEIYNDVVSIVEDIKKQNHNEHINQLQNKLNDLKSKTEFKPKSKYGFI
tara:strand:+ start:502 stop:906 length:405 start_codon:yes stop_codon:yes gene_type:complete